MNIRKSLSSIICYLKGKHDPGRKFRSDSLWYRACTRCGRVETTTEPKKREKKLRAVA